MNNIKLFDLNILICIQKLIIVIELIFMIYVSIYNLED